MYLIGNHNDNGSVFRFPRGQPPQVYNRWADIASYIELTLCYAAVMIKLVYCIRKRDDIDIEVFYRYWRDDHGSLVKSVSGDIGACRYVQSHTVLPKLNSLMIESRGLAEPYDGITEVWWESHEELERGLSSVAGIEAQKKLIEDESRFIDFSRSRVFMTEEQEIF